MLLNSLVQMLQTELQTWLCEIGSLRLMISQDFSSRHSLSISKSHSHSVSDSSGPCMTKGWAGRQEAPQTIWLPQYEQLHVDSMARMAVIISKGTSAQ